MASAKSATTSPTCRTWWPAPSNSSGCWPRHHGCPRRRTSPGSSAPRWNTGEVTAASAEIAAELRRRGLTDVDDSVLTRALYSSDASLYRVVPQVVVRPRAADELDAILDAGRETGT